MRRELAAFDGWVIPIEQIRSRRVLKALLGGAAPLDTDPRGVALPSKAKVSEIQASVRNVLDQLVEAGEVMLAPQQSHFVITRDAKWRRSFLFRVPGPAWGGQALVQLLGRA